MWQKIKLWLNLKLKIEMHLADEWLRLNIEPNSKLLLKTGCFTVEVVLCAAQYTVLDWIFKILYYKWYVFISFLQRHHYYLQQRTAASSSLC